MDSAPGRAERASARLADVAAPEDRSELVAGAPVALVEVLPDVLDEVLPDVLEEVLEDAPPDVLEDVVPADVLELPDVALPVPGLAVGFGTAAAPAAAAASTGRNCICDERRSVSSVLRSGTSGIDTTMLFSPWVVTSAPETPWLSTRCAMMSRAWLTCSVVTFWSPTSRGVSTI